MLSLLLVRMKKIHLKLKALEWSQHYSNYKSMGIFSNAQGQLTLQSLVWSCQISNPFEILWLSSLPAKIKKNQSKIKKLEWSQSFSHYNPMGAICCHGNQSFDSIWPKTIYRQSPTPMMLQMKFDNNRLAGLRDIHSWKCGRTHGRTPARVPSYKLILILLLWRAKKETLVQGCSKNAQQRETTEANSDSHQLHCFLKWDFS